MIFRFTKTWRLKSIFAGILFLVLIAIFQNCGNQMNRSAFPGEAEVASTDASSAASPKFTNDCLANSAYDVCLFYKSAEVQWNRFLTPVELEAKTMDDLRNYSVVLNNDHKNQFFSDSVFTVKPALPKGYDGKLKFPYSTANHDIYSRLMVSYWSIAVVDFFRKAQAPRYLENQSIVIDTNATKSGWSHARKTLGLKKGKGLAAHALDASVLVHLLGEASISLATSADVYQLKTDSVHKACGTPGGAQYTNDCCSSLKGCTRAITSGLSDYLVAEIFQAAPGVASGISQLGDGSLLCNHQARNVHNYGSAKFADVYKSCAASGQAGQVHVMGIAYASLWWNVRMRVVEENAKDLQPFQKLYGLVLGQIGPEEDFVSLQKKIEAVDTELFGGRFTPFFRAEIKERGL